ncbi:MAG: phosphoribosyltransferase family protein [Patescibacteria group bacterium]
MLLLNTIFNSVLSIVFPVKCLSCGQNGRELCIKCLSNIRVAERETAEWIFPIYDYRDPPIKKALWLLKYKGKKRLAIVFAEIVHGKILEELSDLSLLENFRNPILIPIPLSKNRLRERGYNQVELICKEIIKLNDLRHGVNMTLENNILIKPKETEHQARIENRRERLKNIVGSFAVKNEDKNKLKNKNVILIDDITTTGATLDEARKTLRKAGAKKIIAFTVAH